MTPLTATAVSGVREFVRSDRIPLASDQNTIPPESLTSRRLPTKFGVLHTVVVAPDTGSTRQITVTSPNAWFIATQPKSLPSAMAKVRPPKETVLPWKNSLRRTLDPGAPVLFIRRIPE